MAEIANTFAFLTRVSLGIVALLAVLDVLRRPSKTRLDIALMLGSLGLPGIVQLLPGPFSSFRPLTTLASMAVVAQPYLLLRLVDDFRPIPTRYMRLTFAAMAASWVFLLTFGEAIPRPAALAIIAYFFVVDGFGTIAFIRSAVQAEGPARWRLSLGAAGSGILAGTILLFAFPQAESSPVLHLFTSALPILVALSYYLAFAPPAWLRRVWQSAELSGFFDQVARVPAGERTAVGGRLACRRATSATGGQASVLVLQAPGSTLSLEASDDPRLARLPFSSEGSLAERLLQGKGAALAMTHRSRMPPNEARLAASIGADAVMGVSVATSQRVWGVLMTFHTRGSLFEADDLATLARLSARYGLFLDNNELVNEQRRLVLQVEAANAEQRRLVDQLQAVNKELEGFSYSVSHDLRAPIRAVAGFSQMLVEECEKDLNTEGRRYLSVIQSETNRMGQLIDDLLSFSRMGRRELAPGAIDMKGMVEGVLEDLKPSIGAREIRFEIGNLPPAKGDAAMLRQVWTNLLANAIKFTRPRSDARVVVTGTPGPEASTYAVRDNGAGFDMRYADKLFGVFQRLHSVEEFEGTGVGLAIVQRVIQRHGGKVWAEGRVGEGATFSFTLPPVQAAQEKQDAG